MSVSRAKRDLVRKEVSERELSSFSPKKIDSLCSPRLQKILSFPQSELAMLALLCTIPYRCHANSNYNIALLILLTPARPNLAAALVTNDERSQAR
jgi:hypothetical protein